ncbi:MAG: hypothetical protein LBJ57_01485 [Prevotellaceae bacterium]|nr:hypothetical protein [Prevotellaceae bacterium]
MRKIITRNPILLSGVCVCVCVCVCDVRGNAKAKAKASILGHPSRYIARYWKT